MQQILNEKCLIFIYLFYNVVTTKKYKFTSINLFNSYTLLQRIHRVEYIIQKLQGSPAPVCDKTKELLL